MHKKSIIALVLICLGVTLESKAQMADFSKIRTAIEAKFWIDLDSVGLCETIIFNGVAYNSSTINDEIKNYKSEEILVTELVALTETILMHYNCNLMMILGTGYNQTKEDKIRILESARGNLNENVPELKMHDYLCSNCKQVMVDGRSYGMYETKKIVNGLKPKDIKYIAAYESANPSVYGGNSQNGLIEIFLTEKKKKKISW